MPPLIKYRQLSKWLRRNNFVIIRQKGSHQRWQNSEGTACTVPKHKELAFGTFMSICEQIDVSAKKIISEL